MERYINRFGTTESKYFVNSNGLAFDFVSGGEITVLIFRGAATKYLSYKKILDFWKQYIYFKTKILVNVVIVGDEIGVGNYSINFKGVKGVVSNIWELSRLLYDKIYQKGTTKKVIVFGDCGGAIPAMLSSTIVPYHSINLTTPSLDVIGEDHEYDTSQSLPLWLGMTHATYIHKNWSEYKKHFNIITYLENFIENPNCFLNLHWAKNLSGVDLLHRDAVEKLPKKSNLKITDHIIPENIDGHLLIRYLIDTKIYYKMVVDEVLIQHKYLNPTI